MLMAGRLQELRREESLVWGWWIGWAGLRRTGTVLDGFPDPRREAYGEIALDGILPDSKALMRCNTLRKWLFCEVFVEFRLASYTFVCDHHF